MEFKHKTVLQNELIKQLDIKKDGIYVDCTLGGGGHTREILKLIGPSGKVIGIDQDQTAIQYNLKQFSEYEQKFIAVKSNFEFIDKELQKLKIKEVDGICYDLGVSSPQLDEASRGFSYNNDAPLDMRMDTDSSLSAYDVVNSYSEEELGRLIKDYGEEKWAKRIANFIVKARPIETTLQLVDVIKGAIPAAARREGPHPAKRTFQAIRIEVNDELAVVRRGVENGLKCLKPGGRMAVITFHSLEDRIIKKIFKEQAKGCICPKDLPMCVCKNEPKVKLVQTKPIMPSEEELENNHRARSAKLRAVERL
ncbi:16S rRNA (cytosine(1402)-N(4))-methyltransferase RsmH [Proteinivorax hydrogeniformans]|uniref:Ribosomal RNA small subunit methyltransferase H n=1 Tax=Proteinivorax hydrogeniformans TaxID=1826727 RepID=A0AAU8HPL3_9FIRM